MVGCGRVLKGWATTRLGVSWVSAVGLEPGEEGSDWWLVGKVQKDLHGIIESFHHFRNSYSEENLIFIASAGRWGPTLAVPLGSWKGLVNKAERLEIHLSVSFLAWFSKIWWKLNGYHRLRIYQVVTATGRMKTSCFLVGPSSIKTQNMMEGIYLRDI